MIYTAKSLSALYGHNWSDMGLYEQQDYADEARRLNDLEYDGAPYCTNCKALKKRGCSCGPIANNN